MSVTNLFGQSITIHSRASYNAQGREVMGTNTTVKARVQPSTKTRLMAGGAVLVIDAIAYVGPTVAVNIDDKVVYDSIPYKVINKYPTPDGTGQTNHIRLELQKWQAT